ncbi:hypothetical protein GHT06_022593 [Daphnia sinensis]|uniref:Uncharacterized protein n=1 Tax=Daphnia sinensis TaxID=1820382 RepID=A0AAD5KXE6_9CRUS|nr:hypothetical protein GHT06_022593 [Daphnia sinensis]
MKSPPAIIPTPNEVIYSPTISSPSNPIPETLTLPIRPERRLGLRPLKLLKTAVKF